MLNRRARITKDGREAGPASRFCSFAEVFFRILSAAHLNFYSGADRLTDELTDSVDADTAPKESRSLPRLKANLAGSLPMRDKSPRFGLNVRSYPPSAMKYSSTSIQYFLNCPG